MAYKQNPGRGPMMKTGRNIPDTFKGPMAAAGPGDGIKKKLERVTGTTHRGGLFSGNQMAMTENKNTDLLEVAGNAIKKGVEKVKSFFN